MDLCARADNLEGEEVFSNAIDTHFGVSGGADRLDLDLDSVGGFNSAFVVDEAVTVVVDAVADLVGGDSGVAVVAVAAAEHVAVGGRPSTVTVLTVTVAVVVVVGGAHFDVAVGIGVGISVGIGVSVRVSVGVSIGVRVGVSVRVGIRVGIRIGVRVLSGVRIRGNFRVGVRVGRGGAPTDEDHGPIGAGGAVRLDRDASRKEGGDENEEGDEGNLDGGHGDSCAWFFVPGLC